MQPSNQRLETGLNNNTSMNSSVDGSANPDGKGFAQNNRQQQQLQPRQSANERREQQQQQRQQQQHGDDEPRRVSLAELFAEDGESDDGISNTSDDPSVPPETLEALSKRLGLKPEQVYNVKIPLADGAEPLTIGQLKDRVGELVDLETREMHFEQRRLRAEGDLLRSQSEIRDILAMIPKEHISPEIVNKIRKRHDENMKRERAMTLDYIPEWRDEKRAAEDLQGMTDFLGEYGFDNTFLGTVHDHRAIKFIRDMYLRDKRIKRALADVKTANARGQRGSTKTKKPARAPVQQQSSRKNVVPDQRTRIVDFFNQSE